MRAKAAQDVDPLDELRQAPLSFRLIRRLFGYMLPYMTLMI